MENIEIGKRYKSKVEIDSYQWTMMIANDLDLIRKKILDWQKFERIDGSELFSDDQKEAMINYKKCIKELYLTFLQEHLNEY